MCEVSKLAIIHVCEDLAKFGYMLERKVEKFRKHALFWQHTRAYCVAILPPPPSQMILDLAYTN
jgi:hypothetical protein